MFTPNFVLVAFALLNPQSEPWHPLHDVSTSATYHVIKPCNTRMGKAPNIGRQSLFSLKGNIDAGSNQDTHGHNRVENVYGTMTLSLT